MNSFPHDTITPFKNADETKKKQVEKMFDDIAFRYDFLNRFLSAGIDVWWRKKAIGLLKSSKPKTILDVATGTGDFAITSYKILHPNKIIGIDISNGMLEIGRKKVAKAGLESKIELKQDDSENLSFANETFEAATVAFGVRNFENLERGLLEINRVLQPNGKLIILEFTRPTAPIVKQFYHLYMKYITPFFGKLFSKNESAYQYLNDSIFQFPERENLVKILKNCNYRTAFYKTLTFGICTIYCAEK